MAGVDTNVSLGSSTAALNGTPADRLAGSRSGKANGPILVPTSTPRQWRIETVVHDVRFA